MKKSLLFLLALLPLAAQANLDNWQYGTQVGSKHYWDHGTGPGSAHFWQYGTSEGSLYFWRHGDRPWSEYHWQHGSGPMSAQHWQADPNAPLHPVFVAMCIGARLNIPPCIRMQNLFTSTAPRRP